MADLKELVYGCRSFRRFDEGYGLGRAELAELADLGRMAPSGMNRQWIRYMLIHEEASRAQVFSCLAWAAYLKDWDGPAPGERPTGYIILLEDDTYGKGLPIDAGFAAQNILLGAVARGLGGCVLGGIDREKLTRSLGIPASMRVALVIALGKPVETVRIVEMVDPNDVRYWREGEIHCVPKRALADVLVDPRCQIE